MKQDLKKEMFELEQELDIPSHLRWHNSKPKQETLEEAAKEYANKQSNISMRKNPLEFSKSGEELWEEAKEDFKAGAKWQQERSYSEEEVRTLINRVTEFFSHHDPDEWKEWIEKQFKKK